MCQAYLGAIKDLYLPGFLFALLWLLGLKDLPDGRSWHLPSFEWGGHLHKIFGYTILYLLLASKASEYIASSLERLRMCAWF